MAIGGRHRGARQTIGEFRRGFRFRYEGYRNFRQRTQHRQQRRRDPQKIDATARKGVEQMNTTKTYILLVGLSWGTIAVSNSQTADTAQASAPTNSPVVEQPGAPPVVVDQSATPEPVVAEKPSETA